MDGWTFSCLGWKTTGVAVGQSAACVGDPGRGKVFWVWEGSDPLHLVPCGHTGEFVCPLSQIVFGHSEVLCRVLIFLVAQVFCFFCFFVCAMFLPLNRGIQ